MPFSVPNIQTDLQCHHIHAPAGNRCGSPALKGEYYCYHHHVKHAKHRVLIDPEVTRMEIPVLEDRASIFTALAAVVHRLADNTIDIKRSGQMIYALQGMLRALPPEPHAAPLDKPRHPERSAKRAVEGPQQAPPATASGTSSPATQPATCDPPPEQSAQQPPKTISITKDSLVYFLRSRHCASCNAELFPPEELTQRPNPGAPPQVIEEVHQALPAPTPGAPDSTAVSSTLG